MGYASACWFLAVVAAGPICAAVPPRVQVYSSSGSTPAQRILVASVMGIVNKTSPEVYLGEPLWLQELLAQFPATTAEYHSDPAWFLTRYRHHFAGYILYDAETRNEGTSLAGILSAALVDASTEHYAIAAGLTRVQDVRGKTPAWVHANYGAQLSRDHLFSQFKAAGGVAYNDFHLRDFAIFKNGFMFSEPPDVEAYYAAQNDGTRAYGWAPSEYNFFSRASRHNLFGVPADWLQGASATSQWTVPIPPQRGHTPIGTPTRPDAHYVAFVMSDGDNVQFLGNAYFRDPWFGSPYRGRFNMTWDISPLLREINPIAMRYYYTRASAGQHKDFFVNAGGPGLIYPSQSPNIATFVKANSAAMTAADLNIISILDHDFDAPRINAILADRAVLGAMLKIGDAYQGLGGAIHWHKGKPCVSVKYSLWEGFDTRAGLVDALNQAPRDPLHDPNSYSVVNVHPWSPDPLAGVDFVARNVAGHVRLVTLEELILHLRECFGSPPLLIPGDFDRDLDVDQTDFGQLQSCFRGPSAQPLPLACENADFDADNDVDSMDLRVFLGCMSGANRPADAECDG